MNSFDLVKFRNQLLAENTSVEENVLKLKTANPTNATNNINFAQDEETGERGAIREALEENNSPEYMKGYGDGYVDGYQAGKSGLEPEVEINEGQLDEMAKIEGALKNSIEAVISSNPELEGLALKKAIKADPSVIKALAGEELYDNQLNRFIALIKGERTIGQRGRKPNPNKSISEPKTTSAPKEKTPKLKITNPKPNSTKLADLAPSGLDDEEAEMEKQALKAAKGNKRLGNNIEKLAQVTKEMKALAKEYQAAKGTPEEANIVAQLKTLTAQKKALEKKTTPKKITAADLMGDEEF